MKFREHIRLHWLLKRDLRDYRINGWIVFMHIYLPRVQSMQPDFIHPPAVLISGADIAAILEELAV